MNGEDMVNKFTDNELKVIKKYCGDEYEQRCRGIINRSSKNIVRVVNTGMVSSGKSSLFNVLIGSTEKEYFPTGAARTTTLADYYDYGDIEFIDTPGIDVRNEDDALAFSTIMEADIIIMAHNIRTGPLNRSEAEWIEKIVAGMNDIQMCKSRLIFVCTWKDTREKDDDYENIINDVKNMVFKIAGTEIPFFDVSVKKYMNGFSKNKKVLIKNSGINELKSHLEICSQLYWESKHEIDRMELVMLIKEIKKNMEQERVMKDCRMEKIQKRVKDKHRDKYKAWKQVFNYFSTKRQQLSSLQNELSNI